MVDLDGIVVSNWSQLPHCGLQWVTTTALWSPTRATTTALWSPTGHNYRIVVSSARKGREGTSPTSTHLCMYGT
jgi:hypothetical protein